MKKKEINKMNKLTYIKNGDYELPLIEGKEIKSNLSLYARLHLEHLIKNEKTVYTQLKLSNELSNYLEQISIQAEELKEKIFNDLLANTTIPDKEKQPIEWSRAMSALNDQVHEMILVEIVYNLDLSLDLK